MHAFLIGSPPSAAALLLRALSRGDDVRAVPVEQPLLDVPGLPGPGPVDAGLAAAHGPAVHARLLELAVDREGRRSSDPDAGGVVLAADAGLDAAIGFLDAAFPQARFVHVTDGGGADGPALRPGTDAALAAIPADRVRTVRQEDLLEDARAALAPLCGWLGIRYDQALLAPVEHERRRRTGGPARPDVETPFDSASTSTFPAALTALGGSLLVSTYQTNKLVVARADGDALNTHFRDVDKPMGIAVGRGRLALGTRTEVWDLRDMPELAPRLEPVGRHDACYLPRNRHVTGDIAVHEMAFAQGQLWLVATAFSCLATLDADHSFVPRWRPPFVSAIAPGDRCHLNGMAVVDDHVRYVTALGTTDEPRGWTAGKATGGVLMEVPSGEVVAGGLSMPHSPRWHDGELWVLQSGLGALGRVDRATGSVEIVCELPGFTRGMAMVGRTAFIGLSQIRESSSFGDLPITRRLAERQCGVWMVDLDAGAVSGFLRFDDLVQEIFDVAFLPGARYPEIADPTSSAVQQAYALP